MYIAVEILMLHYLCNAGIVFERFIIRQFIKYPQANKFSYSHTYRKSSDIDKRGRLVFKQAAPGYFKIIFYHSFSNYKLYSMRYELQDLIFYSTVRPINKCSVIKA